MVVATGSSPLTRGKRLQGNADAVTSGLIPAHAGKTGSAARSSGALRAHPRSRGENPIGRMVAGGAPGSSPLTRGKRPTGSHPRAVSGLIPAHAGKTRLRASWALRTWAHPRSRGENVVLQEVPEAYQGSSPLTRGKLDKVRGHQGHGGLIPAHAGKTLARGRGLVVSRAHPRSRGENSRRRDRVA